LNADLARDEHGAWIAAPSPAIRTLTFEQLQRYDVGRIRPGTAYAMRFSTQQGQDGVRIPALRDVIAFAEARSHGRIHYNLEIKTTPDRREDTAPPEVAANALVGMIHERGIASRTMVQSFDFAALRRVQSIAPEIPTSCLTSRETVQRGDAGPSVWTAGLDVDSFDGSTPRLVHAAGCRVWSPDFETIDRDTIQQAHSLGLRVVPWTVNEPADIERMVAWGIDGIISDYPDRLMAVAH
jgi:glycerophosphoryl diester phosphodiesterase